MTEFVTSADGTRIAFDRLGTGAPLIMAAGAFNTRATTQPLARALAGRFEVLNYDRRGRGDSEDGAAYAVERELEDLAALIAAAGGAAAVLGYSSGANLVLAAAASGLPVTKLVLYEPPFRADDSAPGLAPDLPRRLTDLVAAGRRGDAVELYQTEAVRMPASMVERLRAAPFRPGLEAIAHTLAYDAAVIGDLSLPDDPPATPALVICGEESSPFMRAAARALADRLPRGELRTLAGQGHGIDPSATAPVIADFLARG